MTDLPELKNEPTVDSLSGDLEDFAHGYLPSRDRRDGDADEPARSRRSYFPVLLAVPILFVIGWHLVAANKLEERLNRNIRSTANELSRKVLATANVNPLTNLVDIRITDNVKRNGASGDLQVLIFEFVKEQFEPWAERELSAASRRDNDLYAMAVPYQVSISIDQVPAIAMPSPSRMVREIQRQLNARGYNPGPADGRLGERTRQAIEQYQRERGIAVDGQASGELLEMLRKQ